MSAWRHATRPYFIPFESENWSDKTKALVERAGVSSFAEDVIWIFDYETRDYAARGSMVIRVKPGCLKREVRAERKEGYVVLMTRPSS